MYLNKIEDPRDLLSRARATDLIKFARWYGVDEIAHDAKAIPARSIIRSKRLTREFMDWARRNVAQTPLGEPQGRAVTSDATNAIDADEDMIRQDREQRARDAAEAEKPVSSLGINELRTECKRLDIKLDRRDNMNSMREKIEAVRNGQNAA